MHVSNFRPVKRIADVLGIFDRVRREIPARLLLIGDGPDRSLAERLAREGGFEDRTIFLGNVPSIETILPVGKLFLLPSDAESFGLAALEAMACGLPVIGTAVGGLPEVVEDGRSGYLRPVGDVDGMAQAALSLLRDPQKFAAFSREARRRAVEEFPTEAAVARYRKLYEETLAGRKRGDEDAARSSPRCRRRGRPAESRAETGVEVPRVRVSGVERGRGGASGRSSEAAVSRRHACGLRVEDRFRRYGRAALFGCRRAFRHRGKTHRGGDRIGSGLPTFSSRSCAISAERSSERAASPGPTGKPRSRRLRPPAGGPSGRRLWSS